MEESITFLELAELVLEKTRRPLAPYEIWEEAVNTGLSKKVNTRGKTPWASIKASLYMDIKKHPKSSFNKNRKRPIKFSLKRKSNKNKTK